jgi:hypothetical protein
VRNPNSLMAKILKEKYHPSDNFLQSSLGRRPSYAWRSIWTTKKLLSEGMMWQFGNGKSISIWQDRWILMPFTYSSVTKQVLDHDATISALIDNDTKWWNIPLLQQVFSLEEEMTIYQILVCLRQQCNRLMWFGMKNGDFYVLNAYHLAYGQAMELQGSCLNLAPKSQLWKKVSKVKDPKMVQSFLWKACNNILATKANLHKRGITINTLCPIYGLQPETVGHILWSYPSTRDVWLDFVSTEVLEWIG